MTPSKASAKAIKFLSKITGVEQPKATKWETVFNALFDGFCCSIYTRTDGATDVKAYRDV